MQRMLDPKVFHPDAVIAFDNFPYQVVVSWRDSQNRTQGRVQLWHGSHVVALDHRTGRVYVIRRKRETSSGIIDVIELPNGGIDPGSEPFDTAVNELLEEAGVVAVGDSNWVHLTLEGGMQPIDGLVITQQHAFLLCKGEKVREHETGETDEVLTLSFEELIAMDNRNEFHDPLTPYFIRRAYDWLSQHRPYLLKD